MEIPKIGLGTYKQAEEHVTTCCLDALDIGYRHIDTAQIYENETGVGNAIAHTSIPRGDFFLTSKVWINQFNYQKCKDSVEESLKKLQTDYIDLMLMHRPNTRMDHRSTLDALMELQQEEKIKKFGVSNFPIELLQEAIDHTGGQIYTNQFEYHLYFDPIKIRNFCLENDIIITAYAPFSHGKVFSDTILQSIADKHEKTIAQVALRWLIEQKSVVTLPKASSRSRIEENFQVFDFSLDEEDKASIAKLPKDQRHFNPPFHPIRDD